VASPEEYNLSGPEGSVVFRTLPEGLSIRLADGATGEIVGNPGDGAYLLVRILASPDHPSRVGDEEYVFFSDVQKVLAP
jgi:hypothetical protein